MAVLVPEVRRSVLDVGFVRQIVARRWNSGSNPLVAF
jgi:hypothetical protein